MQVSEIRDLGPAWQQYLPIQSLSQFLSVSTIYALLIGVVYLFTRGSGDPEMFAIVCLGVSVGAFPALVIALPQTFQVELDSERGAISLLKEIDDLLRFRGYRKDDARGSGDVIYNSKLPAPLSWRENRFSISRSDKTIVIRGPRGSVKWLRDRVNRLR